MRTYRRGENMRKRYVRPEMSKGVAGPPPRNPYQGREKLREWLADQVHLGMAGEYGESKEEPHAP